MNYKSNIEKIQIDFSQTIKQIATIPDLEKLKAEYLGKQGLVSNLFQDFKQLPISDKKTIGPLLNQLKININQQINDFREEWQLKQINATIANEKIDLNWPVRQDNKGLIHPITKTINEVKQILSTIGFDFVDGPEIEDEFHNFTALNIPQDHPARQMQDSFYLKDQPLVLRTHTSNVQIRQMKKISAPFQIATIGKVYRADYDQTHTPMFHQMEGFMIDKDINMSNLKWVLEEFLRLFFNSNKINIRFRPSFFPFTEPSAEVDIGYSKANNQIKIGGMSNFLEILGCGMIHPNVLKNVDIDNQKYQGFAFGIGIERLAMLKYGIKDIRMLFENNIDFLKHYGFKIIDILK